jgi:hypothetical protein
MLAGWSEGVTAARQAREEGRDLWSRGSRVSGRIAGGTRNLVGGVRTTVRSRRDRRHQSSTPTPDASPIDVADPAAEPTVGNADQVYDGLDQHPDNPVGPGWPASFRRAASDRQTPASENNDVPQQDGELLFSSKTDDLGAAIHDSGNSAQRTSELDEAVSNWASEEPPAAASEVLEEAPVDDDRYYTWQSPDSGRLFVFDRMNLDEPMPATDGRAAETIASFYNGRHGLATQNGEAPVALAEAPGGGVAEEAAVSVLAPLLAAQIFPATPETPTAAPAMGNTHSTTTWKEATPMAIAGTELGNLDEVDGEAKAALNAIEALTDALNEIKGWGGNLPDRWSGTSWSTDGLDAAIVGVAEEAAELKIPEGLMERLTQIGAEVQKARAVGEVAAETGAKGDLSGFRSN